MRCPNPAQPVQVRAHCRPLPRLRHPVQLNPYVAESVCQDRIRRITRRLAYSQEKRAGAGSP